MQPDSSKHSPFSVPNNRNGVKLIVDRVTSVLQSLDIPQVVIGMEATLVYGDNLMRFFRESGSLDRFDRHLHMLNPKQVKKFRDSYSELPQNDYVDYFVIADHLRFGRINNEVYMDDYKYQALKLYIRARHQTVQDLTREKQLQTIPQTLTSVNGIGNIYAAGIIAEIGNINRFPGQASVAKYADPVWTQH